MKNLKRIVLSLLIMTFCAGVANAEFRFGVKAGMLVNKLSLDKDVFQSSNSYGWTAGAMVEYTVPIIGLNFDAGLMYARMNNNSFGEATITNALANAADVNSLYGKNFLEIPINIKYKFTIPAVASFFKPYLYTGPNIAFRLDKAKELTTQNAKSTPCQVAWNIGLGFEVIRHLQISCSYGFGINNVVKAIDEDINTDNLKAKNNYWTLSAAWLF